MSITIEIIKYAFTQKIIQRIGGKVDRDSVKGMGERAI